MTEISTNKAEVAKALVTAHLEVEAAKRKLHDAQQALKLADEAADRASLGYSTTGNPFIVKVDDATTVVVSRVNKKGYGAANFEFETSGQVIE